MDKPKNKRLVAEKTNELKTVIEDYPDIPDGGLVVKVLMCGICHSDAHFYSEKEYKHFLPRVLESLSAGDKVIVFSWTACRQCSYCLAENVNCQNYYNPDVIKHVYGVRKDGGFQQYEAIQHPYSVIKIPDDIPMEVACLVPCSGITAYNAVTQCKDSIDIEIQITGQARVLIMGPGGLGQWAVEFVKALYGESVLVCAADVFEEKLEQAKAAGADFCVKTSKQDDAQSTASKIVTTAGGKMNAAIDFVNIPQTMETCLNSLAAGGTLAVVGIQTNTFPAVDLQRVIFDSIRIQGISVGQKRHVFDVFQLLSTKKVKGPAITKVAFEDIGIVLDKMAARDFLSGRYVAKIA